MSNTLATGIISSRIDIRDFAIVLAKFERGGYKPRTTSEFFKDLLHKLSTDWEGSDNEFQRKLRENYTEAKAYLQSRGMKFGQDRGTHGNQVRSIDIEEYSEKLEPYDFVEQITGTKVTDEDKRSIEKRAREIEDMINGKDIEDEENPPENKNGSVEPVHDNPLENKIGVCSNCGQEVDESKFEGEDNVYLKKTFLKYKNNIPSNLICFECLEEQI